MCWFVPRAAERELDRLGLPEQDATSGQPQSLGNLSCRGRDSLAPSLTACGGDPTLEVDDVLQGKGHTVERSNPVSRADSRGCGSGRGSCFFGVDDLPRLEGGVELVDCPKYSFGLCFWGAAAIEVGSGQSVDSEGQVHLATSGVDCQLRNCHLPSRSSQVTV